MDAAYFTGRKELLEFFNDLLELKLTKIEQTASGAIACQITELIYPNSIALMKIDWGAKTDYEYVQNYKLLQIAFTKNKIQRFVDVDKLIRAKYQVRMCVIIFCVSILTTKSGHRVAGSCGKKTKCYLISFLLFFWSTFCFQI